MKVLTELELRAALKAGPVKTYRVTRDTIVTPSARAFMAERGIEIATVEEGENGPVEPAHAGEPTRQAGQQSGQPAERPGQAPQAEPRFICLPCGGLLSEKPEYMTHLHGNKLVPKTHPRIKLRGLIDMAEGYIIQAQIAAQRASLPELVRHLDELLAYTRQVLRAEVLDAALPEMKIMGMTAAEIREASHDPRAVLGIKHILPSYQMGEVMSILNIVRTHIRQVELAATDAFWGDPLSGAEPARQDILQALNRLSSAAYVMMCRLAAGKYGGGKSDERHR